VDSISETDDDDDAILVASPASSSKKRATRHWARAASLSLSGSDATGDDEMPATPPPECVEGVLRPLPLGARKDEVEVHELAGRRVMRTRGQ
jgi:hypothetical protein